MKKKATEKGPGTFKKKPVKFKKQAAKRRTSSAARKPFTKQPDQRKQDSEKGRKPFPIVGIGASAGGLEAFSELLKNLPPNLGMAYVFVQHLSPTHKSILPSILEKYTSMKVHEVTDGMPVEADCLYVIPPNAFMSIVDGTLTLSPRPKTNIASHTIDYFFTELAAAYQNSVVGIVLSGAATDGTLGLKAIKAEGGITFAQDETAKFSGMPHHATDAGFVDFVLPPERIAEELASLIKHPYAVSSINEKLAEDEDALRKILLLIHQKYDVDFFSHYKRTTIYRRVIRRLVLNGLKSLGGYLKLLKTKSEELDALYQDFLINVTSFFRDPPLYDSLIKKVFPVLTKGRKRNDPIRVWIPGCATGEETYSTAITLFEFLEKKGLNISVQFFSTDLNDRAIEKARLGIYSKSAVQDLSTYRLNKFFEKTNGSYQIIKAIRDVCVFAPHDLLRDPPFSRMDLISCRNVLIYLESEPQRKILQTFHYALKPTGFLLLGKSESIGQSVDLFEKVDKEAKLYACKSVHVQPSLDFSIHAHPTSPRTARQKIPTRLEAKIETGSDIDIDSWTDRILLSSYVPASVVVNKHLEIVRFRGSTSLYLEPASGKASLHLLKMVRDELVFALKGLINRAKKEERKVEKKGLEVKRKDGIYQISLEVIPIKPFFLIVFKEESAIPEVVFKKGKGKRTDPRIKKIEQLEQELHESREQMKIASEEAETVREELQSANEEILSSNEELQSINEELETSKEELQSSNEELTTINEELQNRNAELKEERDYSEAIIETIRGPLMVLINDFRIQKVNKAFCESFHLPQDETEGQYIYELDNGKWNIPTLMDRLKEVLPKRVSFQDFVINHNFPRAGIRTMIINAYQLPTYEDGLSGLLLLSFEDITERKSAEQKLLLAQEQLKLALISGSVCTWLWNIKTNEIKWSKEEELLYGGSQGKEFGGNYDNWEKAIHKDDLLKTRRAIKDSIENRKDLDTEFRIVWPDGSVRWIMARAQIYYDHASIPEQMAGVHIDITSRKQAEQALLESEKRFQEMSNIAPVMIWMANMESALTFVNNTWLTFRGKTMKEEIHSGWTEKLHPDDVKKFLDIYDSACKNNQEFTAEVRMQQADGTYRWVLNKGVPHYTSDKKVIGYIGTCTDIHDRISLEKQKEDFIGIASHELKTPVTSIKAFVQVLQQKFQGTEDKDCAHMLERMDAQIDRLTHLLVNLLDSYKIESERLDYNETVFDVTDYVEEITEEMQQTTSKHKIVRQLTPELRIRGDRERLSQVLINLVSNAIKYSPDSDEIIVRSKADNGNVVISVQDFGIGIPAGQTDKIFDRFFRTSESESKKIAGLGLGLYISAQIIKQHRGRIWVDSAPDKGSVFCFSVPLTQP